MNIYTKRELNACWVPKLVRHTLRKTFALCVLATFLLPGSQAQDVHFSQFYNAPMTLNPGLTGLFGGDTRVTALYRSQWSSVPVDYITFSGAVDKKFLGKNSRKGFFSGGFIFNYDQASPTSKMQAVNVGLTGSYTKTITSRIFGTGGLQMGFNQRSFKLEDLTFDNQYDPLREWFDGSLPSRENLLNTSRFSFDISFGFNLRIQALNSEKLVDRLQKRSKVDIGIGFYHVNRPNQSFYEDSTIPLATRISPHILGTLQLGSNFDLLGNINAQFQSPYREYVAAIGGKAHLSTKLGKQTALLLMVGYRFNNEFGDAFVPSAEVHYNSLRVGFSYDINISGFDLATGRRGGPEFTLRYLIRNVKALPAFKICPII